MTTVFQNRLAEAVRAGRAAADTAIGQWEADKDSEKPLTDYEPEDVGYTETEILLKITGHKTLHDPQEEEDITSTFADSFYNALEEYAWES